MPRLNSDQRAHLGGHGEDVRVRELDALGWPGRARRVDQRCEVAWLYGRGVLQFVGVQQLKPRVRSDDDDMLYGAATALERGEQAVNQRRLCDDDSAVGVGDQVGELFGRRGVVHREGCGAEEQRAGIGNVEFGPVAEQEPERVPLSQSQRG